MNKLYKQRLNSVRSEDKYALIILDACRYDSLNQYINIEVERLQSDVPNTHTWIKTYWQDYYDATYISPVPWVSNREIEHDNAGTYNGSLHFDEVIESWNYSWCDDLGTVRPDHLAEDANNNIDDKMIIHFIQPHFPHIGEPSLGKEDMETLEEFHQQDEISDGYLQRSYQANLDKVWKEGVQQLNILNDENRRVVITADHGEVLGEDDQYGHNSFHNKVINVPWIEY